MNIQVVKKMIMVSWAFCLLFVMTPVGAAEQTTFSRIVVFGDSLSDPGNAFVLRRALSTPPYDTLDALLVPEAPYAKGGHHFSNGATWIEQFARPLGLAGSVRPAFQSSSTKAANYAVGGARAYADGDNVNLSAQVSAFLTDAGGMAPSDGLYVIEIGGNDVRDALMVFASGGDAGALISASLASIGYNIGALHAAGANKFLIWNTPDLRLTPSVLALDSMYPGMAIAAGMLGQAFNDGLDTLLGTLSGLPGITIKTLDVFQKVNDLAADPAAYGLEVVNAACVTPNVPPFDCQEPDAYLFWDGIHPTRVVHGILAQEAADLLAQ